LKQAIRTTVGGLRKLAAGNGGISATANGVVSQSTNATRVVSLVQHRTR